MISILVLISIISAIYIFINPAFGLGLTLIMTPVSTQMTVGESFLGLFSIVTPIKIIGTMTFISVLIHYAYNKSVWDFLKKPQIKTFSLFLIWIFISGFSHPGSATRENFTTFISNLILGLTILVLINEIKRFRLMLWLIVISMSLICLKTILFYVGIGNRAGGTGYGPNEFAIMILPFIAIIFYLALIERNKILKFITFGMVIIIFLALISTVSRGGIIGLAGMFLIFILRSKNKIFTIILAAIVVVLFINLMPQNLRERFENTQVSDKAYGTGVGDVDSTTRRYYLAQAAWKMFLDHPILGIGIGNYYYENRNYAPVYPGRAHNMYLEIMAELGTIGLVLFLGILFSTFKGLNRIIKSKTSLVGYAKGFYVGLAGFLVAGIFLHAEQDRILWFLIFMSVALERIYEKNYI